MPQHDMIIANANFPTLRADVNDALAALVANSSGATAPATTYAYQFWADTTSGWLKQRNAANSAWIFVQPLAGHAEASVASATTTDLGAQISDLVLISGTTTITGFGTADAGRIVKVRHSGAALLTHNGTSLILPGAADITTAAGDTYEAESLGSGNWVVRAYQKASGLAVVSSVTSGPTFSAYSASTQNPTSGVATKVVFGTEDWDTNSNFASSTFTPTVAGYYQVNAQVSLAADTSLTAGMIHIYRSGAAYATAENNANSGNSYLGLSISSIVYCNGTTDTIEIYATATGTGASRYIFAHSGAHSTIFNAAFIRG
jgi:hypothetical protein